MDGPGDEQHLEDVGFLIVARKDVDTGGSAEQG